MTSAASDPGRPRVQTLLSEERRGQIVRLLETLDDGLPSPARAPLSQLGFVHRASFRESCPDCLANGFVSRDCESCDGAGFLEGRRSRDPYDTGQNRGWLGAAALEAAKERDREIARLEAQTAEPRPAKVIAASTKPDRWEKERERLRGEFDYAAVQLALERLAVEDQDACHAIHAVLVYGYLRPAASSAHGVLERGLRLLSGWLPERLRAPLPIEEVEVLMLDLRVRNAAVRRRSRVEGATSQMLAREYGLSVSQVNRILAGAEDPE